MENHGTFRNPNENDTTIKIWDTLTYQEITTLTGHNDCVRAVCFSQDDRVLISGSDDKTIILWDTIKYKEITILTGHTDEVNTVCFQPEQYDYLLK